MTILILHRRTVEGLNDALGEIQRRRKKSCPARVGLAFCRVRSKLEYGHQELAGVDLPFWLPDFMAGNTRFDEELIRDGKARSGHYVCLEATVAD